MSTRSRGFTLIELMVVVAVIILLVAILLPSLSKAREVAKTAVCQNNMRQIAHLAQGFASRYDGRGPGRGDAAFYGSDGSWHRFELEWSIILDNEFLGHISHENPGSTFNEGQYGAVRWGPASAITLSCPNFVSPLASYFRPFAWNKDAAGGDNWITDPHDPNHGNSYGDLTGRTPGQYGYSKPGPYWGIYGKAASPKSVLYYYPGNWNAPANVNWYAYGAKLALFAPNQFLFVEHERAADDVDGLRYAEGSYPNGTVPLGGAISPPYPAYSSIDINNNGGAGAYSFRHPYFKKGNFAFMDGHVELLKPCTAIGGGLIAGGDDIDSARRFSVGGQ